MGKHQKHSKLERRVTGTYATNELAFVGVKCSVIDTLVQEISSALEATYRIAYMDASHDKNSPQPVVETYTFSYAQDRFDSVQKQVFNPYSLRNTFAQYDLVLINGNHFPASKYIVILDSEKEASIEKRLGQIQDVCAFIHMDTEVQVFDCLQEKFPHFASIPNFSIQDSNAIQEFVTAQMSTTIPPVQGLVLAGGKSTRMGKDKSQLHYYDTDQQTRTIGLLESLELPVYLSLSSSDQKDPKIITDSFTGLGPFGAICSAFQKHPNCAWIVLPIDVPFVDAALLEILLSKRDPSKIATAIKGVGKEFPEPLLSIWEPKSYPILLQYLAQGYSCPRKVLINEPVAIYEVADHYIQNINTPEEYTQAIEQLKNSL